MTTIKQTFSLFLFSLLFISCSSQQDDENLTSYNIVKKTIFKTKTLSNEDFILQNIDNKVTLKNNNKEFLFLIFFTTNCQACKAQISVLNNLNNKYKNIKFLSLVLDSDDIDTLSFFKTKHKITYPISYKLLENEDLLKSITHKRSVPYMVLYDKKGNYITHYSTAVVQEMMDIEFSQL